MKAFFHTLGCKVNQYETEAMRSLLDAAGFETGDYTPGDPVGEDAVVVINSCTVTGESDRKLRQLLRSCKHFSTSFMIVSSCLFSPWCPQRPADGHTDIIHNRTSPAR